NASASPYDLRDHRSDRFVACHVARKHRDSVLAIALWTTACSVDRVPFFFQQVRRCEPDTRSSTRDDCYRTVLSIHRIHFLAPDYITNILLYYNHKIKKQRARSQKNHEIREGAQGHNTRPDPGSRGKPVQPRGYCGVRSGRHHVGGWTDEWCFLCPLFFQERDGREEPRTGHR